MLVNQMKLYLLSRSRDLLFLRIRVVECSAKDTYNVNNVFKVTFTNDQALSLKISC